MSYNIAPISFEDPMALPPNTTTGSTIEDTFLADRAMFWTRFTSFTKGSVIAIVVLLIGMLIFLV